VDQVLTKTTLKDLLGSEPQMISLMTDLVRFERGPDRESDNILTRT
jgi:hypothetical protein